MAAILIAVLGGCSASPKPLTYFGHADLEYYKGLSTKIDYPSKTGPDNPGALASLEPPLLRHPRKDQLWDMSLGQAMRIALMNNKIIRTRDQFVLPRNPLVTNPEQIPSVFDPAVQETGILFGQRGVEAALSDFDATLSSNLTFNDNTVAENNAGLSGVPTINGLPTLIQDTAQFRTRLDKTFADSSQLSFINEWDYTQNNVVGNLLPQVYTGFVRAEFRRPLLAGGGTDYTRIAGPIGKNPAGVGQGVVIARINSDIAIADFEGSVQQLIRDVQSSYWDLSLAYQTYHAQVIYWKSALKTWEQIDAKRLKGLTGGTTPDESQARENYFDAKAQAEQSLSNLYTTEGQFRRLLGLTVNDGRIIRPCDEPSVAEFVPDWHIAVAEGVTRRPEIRRQKWNIKSIEMQLDASKSLLMPRFDLVAGAQINAFGDRLISQQSTLNQPGSSAFASLVEAGQTGWDIGFEASIPIGFRNAHSQERNFELRLTRARTALAHFKCWTVRTRSPNRPSIAASRPLSACRPTRPNTSCAALRPIRCCEPSKASCRPRFPMIRRSFSTTRRSPTFTTARGPSSRKATSPSPKASGKVQRPTRTRSAKRGPAVTEFPIRSRTPSLRSSWCRPASRRARCRVCRQACCRSGWDRRCHKVPARRRPRPARQ
jgi:hypothetical protein